MIDEVVERTDVDVRGASGNDSLDSEEAPGVLKNRMSVLDKLEIKPEDVVGKKVLEVRFAKSSGKVSEKGEGDVDWNICRAEAGDLKSYSEGPFDFVLSVDFASSVRDERKIALSILEMVKASEGKVCFSVPSMQREGVYYFGQRTFPLERFLNESVGEGNWRFVEKEAEKGGSYKSVLIEDVGSVDKEKMAGVGEGIRAKTIGELVGRGGILSTHVLG
jgi:hypothetical protein